MTYIFGEMSPYIMMGIFIVVKHHMSSQFIGAHGKRMALFSCEPKTANNFVNMYFDNLYKSQINMAYKRKYKSGRWEGGLLWLLLYRT